VSSYNESQLIIKVKATIKVFKLPLSSFTYVIILFVRLNSTTSDFTWMVKVAHDVSLA
jgi:hypothetical protein